MNIAMMGYVTGASLLDLSLPHLYAEANRNSAAAAARTSFWRSSMKPTPGMRRLFSLMLRHVTGLGAIMGLGLAFFRRDIFAIIAGPEFRNAAALMPWVAGIPLTFLLSTVASRALLVQNRSLTVGVATLGAAVVNLGVNLVVVPIWGPHGAALSTLGSLLALALFLCALIDVPCWIDRAAWKPFRLLAGIACCAAADWLIVTLLPDASHWIRLPLAAVPALLTCWLAQIFTPADMALLKSANSSAS
jgi:O-antigen/teichoic acid export membrane protein